MIDAIDIVLINKTEQNNFNNFIFTKCHFFHYRLNNFVTAAASQNSIYSTQYVNENQFEIKIFFAGLVQETQCSLQI